MKASAHIALAAAALTASASAQPHNHQHHHHGLAKKHQHLHNQHKRAIVTVTDVVYVLEGSGDVIPDDEASKGIEQGMYIVVGTSTPTPASSAASAPASSSAAHDGAQFFEVQAPTSATGAAASPTSETENTSDAAASPGSGSNSNSDSNSNVSSGSSSSSSSASLVNADFPDGQIDCGDFAALAPYGAIPAVATGMNGWASIVTGVPSIAAKLSDIVMGVPGSNCEEGCICSYACQPGWQKTQWPEEAQGAQGQTVGGIYCSGGKLHLTRSSVSTKLCAPGEGGVFVKSELSAPDAVCRTDYPGSESMVIPLEVDPGQTVPLTNPLNTYFEWQGKTTTAQYYVNPKGVPVKDACQWNSPSQPSCAGNWAPTNLGVGKDPSGITYLSIFANAPTSKCTLDFDITITGDISGECSLKSGVYSTAGGCTVGVMPGGTATFVFSESS